jgi:hypothetical protein
MGLEFLDRTLKTSGVLLLIFLPFGFFYFGAYLTLSVFSGGVWGMLNLMFISALVRATIKPGKVDRGRALGLGLFKFPLLYVSLYALMKIPHFDPIYVGVGLSTVLIVILLKVAGRAMVAASDQPQPESNAQRTA